MNYSPSQMLLIIAMICIAQTTNAFAPSSKTSSAPTFVRSQIQTQKYNIIDVFGSMISNFGKEATASHILITPKTWVSQDDAADQLRELKARINDDPVAFAEAASEISECPSNAKGGDLGAFGPGRMVVNFDKICFNEEVGKVHGPVSTQFGEHLILITERTGGDE